MNLNNAAIALWVFIAVSVLNAVGVWMEPHWLLTVTKPLLMPTLIWWLIAATRGVYAPLKTGWILGLALSTIGDIILMFDGTLAFIFGLAAFLLAHIAFIGTLNKAFANRRGFAVSHPFWGIMAGALPIGMMIWLWSGIPGEMLIPVVMYILVISTLLLTIVNLNSHVDASVFLFLMTGALLFAISDSLIAQAKFRFPLPANHLLVMITYIIAQYLMVKGIIRALRLYYTDNQTIVKPS